MLLDIGSGQVNFGYAWRSRPTARSSSWARPCPERLGQRQPRRWLASGQWELDSSLRKRWGRDHELRRPARNSPTTSSLTRPVESCSAVQACVDAAESEQSRAPLSERRYARSGLQRGRHRDRGGSVRSWARKSRDPCRREDFGGWRFIHALVVARINASGSRTLASASAAKRRSRLPAASAAWSRGGRTARWQNCAGGLPDPQRRSRGSRMRSCSAATPTGTSDTSVGNQGYPDVRFQRRRRSGGELVIEPDGRVVLAGYATMNATGKDFALVRVWGDTSPPPSFGDLDPSFDGDGRASTLLPGWSTAEYGYAVAVQSDGKILAAGRADNDFAVVRYSARRHSRHVLRLLRQGGHRLWRYRNSTRSTIWSSSATARSSPSGWTTATIWASSATGRRPARRQLRHGRQGQVRVHRDGRRPAHGAEAVALQGRRQDRDGRYGPRQRTTQNDFGVVRLNADGTLDTTFGTGGKVVTPDPRRRLGLCQGRGDPGGR